MRQRILAWLEQVGYVLGPRGTVIALVGVLIVLLAIAVIASDRDEGGSSADPQATADLRAGTQQSDSARGHSRMVSARTGEPQPPNSGATSPYPYSARVSKHEALPCTGPDDPINFQIFSVGPSIAGVPLTDFKRRCGGDTPVDEPPANFINYIYGRCEIEDGDSGCTPPLEIQTWPGCQRTLADYSFEGKPIPHRELPKIGEAKVVLIEFMFEPRIEVYTGSSTVVIFAENPDLAEAALTELRSQDIGKPPARQAGELDGPPDEHLAAPTKEALEGELKC